MDVIRHRIRAGGYRRRKRKSLSAGDLQANHEGLKQPARLSTTTTFVIAFDCLSMSFFERPVATHRVAARERAFWIMLYFGTMLNPRLHDDWFHPNFSL
jgi:hypothetical protein